MTKKIRQHKRHFKLTKCKECEFELICGRKNKGVCNSFMHKLTDIPKIPQPYSTAPYLVPPLYLGESKYGKKEKKKSLWQYFMDIISKLWR